MIKILHITLNLSIGGTQQVVRQIVENTSIESFEHHILCIDGSLGSIGEQLDAKGFLITVYQKKPSIDLNLALFIRTYIKKHFIDVLHCHQYTPYFYGVLGGLTTKVNIVFTEHGRFYPDRHNFKRRLINPLLSFFTDEIVAISGATANALSIYEYLNWSRVKVIYNGMKDLTEVIESRDLLLNDLGLSSEYSYVGTISRLEPIKNQKMMIEAFSILRAEVNDVRLVIIGDGVIRDELESYVTRLGLDQEIKFTGYIDDPQKYMQLFKVFLLSSFSEGASMTILEAMSLSVPCLVTDVGGNPELVIDRVNGRVVPSDDSRLFASALKEMLSDELKLDLYATAARKQFVDKFTVDRMVLSYESMYVNCKQ
jgi:glycosyltransferase involved in cell wall biosynthesis